MPGSGGLQIEVSSVAICQPASVNSYAGESAEAAKAYFEAGDVATAERDVELRIAGAQQFLRADTVDEGMDALRRLLGSLQMRFPEIKAGGLVAMATTATRLALGGLELAPHATTEIDPADLRRLECCRAALPMAALASAFGSPETRRRRRLPRNL